MAFGFFLEKFKIEVKWKLHQLWNYMQRIYYYHIRGEMVLRRRVFIEREMVQQFANMNLADAIAENPLEPAIVDWHP